MSGDYTYIWESADWPAWRFDLPALATPLADVSRAQGMLAGRLADVGLARDEASLAALTEDVVKTSAIEGESLNVASVRSSIARRLGSTSARWRRSIVTRGRGRHGAGRDRPRVVDRAPARVDIGALAPVDRHARAWSTWCWTRPPTRRHRSRTPVCSWHAALFPTGYSGMSRITVGGWRTDATGPMQVVRPDRPARVHFEAPPAARLAGEIARFRVAQCRAGFLDPGRPRPFRFVTPIRSTTATAGLRASGIWSSRAPTAVRSASTACRRKSSASATPITTCWSGRSAARSTSRNLARRHGMARVVPDRARQGHRPRAHDARRGAGQGALLAGCAGFAMNERQVKVESPARRLRGEAPPSGRRSRSARDTALRDITELVEHGVLRRSSSGGRSTSYELMPFSG